MLKFGVLRGTSLFSKYTDDLLDLDINNNTFTLFVNNKVSFWNTTFGML